MKITFFSNFMNHHQLPFCEEMVNLIGDDFKFVATSIVPEERTKLGYKSMNKKYSFIIRAYENEEEAYRLANESDIVIIGSASDKYIRKRLKEKKLIFRYSERIFRKSFNIKSILYIFFKRTIMEKNNTYLLCSSAYTSNDYNSVGAYKNKAYKWGYFPEAKVYKNINDIIDDKENNSILWVARFIELKHPEVVIDIANRLKKDNYLFTIKMIGIGEQYYKIKKSIEENKLDKFVKLCGSMSPEDVRYHMEKSSIFLFTSDKNEGWGAVLNEAMNSGCAVVASHEIGSVPFMIEDNINGIIYEDGNTDDLYGKLKYLLENGDFRKNLSKNAYSTIVNLWNPKVASKRLIILSQKLLTKKNNEEFKTGPCSIAERLNDDWYKRR